MLEMHEKMWQGLSKWATHNPDVNNSVSLTSAALTNRRQQLPAQPATVTNKQLQIKLRNLNNIDFLKRMTMYTM